MVFQNYALYPHMTVEENLEYGSKISKVEKTEIEKKVMKLQKDLRLDNLRQEIQLSGGQRQRVAMGRAIVRILDVFLFDEPLSNLDAKLRSSVRKDIKKFQRRMGVTSIYVTHDQVEAMTLADRIIIMKNGFIEQIGSPIDVFTFLVQNLSNYYLLQKMK